MSDIQIAFTAIVILLLLLAVRVPIGVALGSVSIIGIAIVKSPRAALGSLGSMPYDFAAHWTLSAVPMFLLMGAIAYHSGLTHTLYRGARLWLSFLPGGLAVATNFASAGFAAASGSSLATAAAMGRLAIPEMLKLGYDKALTTGVVAAAGTLGSLIPPSILMVLYGWFTEQPISKLLIAGILPGLLTAAVYTVMIVARCKINPSLAPKVEGKVTWQEKFSVLREIWPLPLLILGVIGGIYGGVVTPTEAGAFGASLSALIALVQGKLSWTVIKDSVLEAMNSTASIFFVAIGAVMLSRFLAFCGMPAFMGSLIEDWALDPLMLVIGTSLIYLILGMFLDPIGLMLLTLPILLPMFEALDLDLIWLGVLVIKYLEIGLLTPPVGMNAYIIKGVVGDQVGLTTIFRGLGWFLVCELLIVVLLIAYPSISTYLPSLME
ncbi:MAG: TRAP transporter large permease subunit [Gammaproteobacteria bacterium]|nr:TRAP transporter large permease subunit [Gammaproteobacteria bacterium]